MQPRHHMTRAQLERQIDAARQLRAGTLGSGAVGALRGVATLVRRAVSMTTLEPSPHPVQISIEASSRAGAGPVLNASTANRRPLVGSLIANAKLGPTWLSFQNRR